VVILRIVMMKAHNIRMAENKPDVSSPYNKPQVCCCSSSAATETIKSTRVFTCSSMSLAPFLAGATGAGALHVGWHLYSKQELVRLKTTTYKDLWEALDAYDEEKKRDGFVYEVLRAYDQMFAVVHEPWTKANDQEKSFFHDALENAVEALVSPTPKTTGAAVFLPLAAGALSAVAFGFAVQHSMRSDHALEGDVVKLCKLLKLETRAGAEMSIVKLILAVFRKESTDVIGGKSQSHISDMIEPFSYAVDVVSKKILSREHTEKEAAEKKVAEAAELAMLRAEYKDLWKALDAYIADKGKNNDIRNHFVHEVLCAYDFIVCEINHEPWAKADAAEKHVFDEGLENKIKDLTRETNSIIDYAILNSFTYNYSLNQYVVQLCKLLQEYKAGNKKETVLNAKKLIVKLLLNTFGRSIMKPNNIIEQNAWQNDNTLSPFLTAVSDLDESIEKRDQIAKLTAASKPSAPKP